MSTARQVPAGRMTQVLACIPTGAEHPRTVADISKATGISPRNVNSIIRALVISYSVPVGGMRSDGRHGVYIITNDEERAAAITPLLNNAREIEHRVNKLRTIEL